jgi:cytochrome c556
MSRTSKALLAALALTLLGGGRLALAQHANPADGADRRELVHFPPALQRETLATMRGHLQGLAEIEQALAEGRMNDAARIATMKLGMSSMHGDQMEQETKYMPPPMRELGAQLHRQAGEFAVAAQDAAATGDTRQPMVLLGRLTQTCVACHAAYRLH